MIKLPPITLLLFQFFLSCKDEPKTHEKKSDIIDKEKTLAVLDYMNYTLNKPYVPEGFTLFYNCDSIAFMKRVIGDTIEFYRKGGFTPLYYSSKTNFNDFRYYIKHYDSTDINYLSGFYEDGRIILENPTYYKLIKRNDSLFNYYRDDSEYMDTAFNLDLLVTSGEMTKQKANSLKTDLRNEYKPVESYNFIFHKNMFDKNTTVVIDKALNQDYRYATLLDKWTHNNKQCYSIALIDSSDIGIRRQSFVFNEEFEFIHDEGCIE